MSFWDHVDFEHYRWMLIGKRVKSGAGVVGVIVDVENSPLLPVKVQVGSLVGGFEPQSVWHLDSMARL